MTPVLAVVNNKGGPGKTTTSAALLRHWQRAGRRPVGIDLDPQANLTRILGGCVNHNNSIGDVLARRTTLDRATQLGADGIHLVGADIKLEDTSAALQGKSPNHMFMANALRDGAADAGVVVIDCAPAANILTINALVAATHVLVVLDPELDAIDGMRRIQNMVEWLGSELGSAPRIVGAVINKVHANALLHRTNLETILHEIDSVGMVPYRRGVDADAKIEEAFGPISAGIWTMMETTNA